MRLLLIEDDENDALLLLHEVRKEVNALCYRRVETLEDLTTALGDQQWDLVISDYYLAGFDCIQALSILQDSGLDIPFIIVSGVIDDETAVNAMKAGAHDYIHKNNLKRLLPAIMREVREAEVRRKDKENEKEISLLMGQLRQSQKMESLGRLAGGIAHDFNNILTVINGYSDLLLSNLEEGSVYKKYAKEIAEAGNRGITLVQQIKAFSRQQVFQPQVLNVNNILTSMKIMLQRMIGEDIKIDIDLAQDIGNIIGDRSQLEQIIMNLAVNARDAMAEGGTLTLTTQRVCLFENILTSDISILPGDYTVLRVSDTGCGMDCEIRKKIFEPFFTTKDENEGTGLGLSTVYGIVKQSQGYITVDSEVGEGTTFTIYFPATPASLQKNPKKSMSQLERSFRSERTILLVEDDIPIHNLISRVLVEKGFKVLPAQTGEEALQIEKEYEKPIHLVIMNIMMPHRNGPDLYSLFKLYRPDIKVLFMSGYPGEEKKYKIDPQFSIQKPFTPSVLALKVHEILNGKDVKKEAHDSGSKNKKY